MRSSPTDAGPERGPDEEAVSAGGRASSPPPAEALSETLRRIYALGLTTTSGGNLSVRDSDGSIWITPAGGDKGELGAADIARVSADGRHADAPRPSSELPFHRAIYAVRDDLRAIVHAHPVSLVAFSVVGEVPDTRVCRDVRALCGSVGFAPYALPGSAELGRRIAEALGAGADCVVLENHGVVVGGRTLREAFERLEALDLCARTIGAARVVGGERTQDEPLPAGEANASAGPGDRATTTNPGPRTEDERRIGEALLRIARRAQRRRLATSRQGRLSARIGPDAFLLAPAGPPLEARVDDLARWPSEVPAAQASDRVAALHAAIYRRHPEVGAIVQGVGAHSTAFAIAGVELPARTIPESYLLVRDPCRIDEREALAAPDAVAARLGPECPVGLIDHVGPLGLGRTLLEAFDRIEVLEATAAAVVAASRLGPLSPMGDARIEALRRTWLSAGGWGVTPPET